MKVVILAGGLGTRISEESQFKPKPMIEIGGMPILWWPVGRKNPSDTSGRWMERTTARHFLPETTGRKISAGKTWTQNSTPALRPTEDWLISDGIRRIWKRIPSQKAGIEKSRLRWRKKPFWIKSSRESTIPSRTITTS